ncbi:sigma factor-like helix-turn-helix DNA-binding protein [Peribacillus glennii]|uniref:RNA polymerase sigma factor 70 region 4 type 2 domain-containing protein n=1 Tax=Peribacillus glennii TaxID=2303991 RepID=A0A372LE62_9BACI|nr:sigma factor-like helix-turn-helix DNA-binding protein [Peribacillus glennii]RFU63505.1 hypothetical protein D0466_12315 [Peribacillus glennii]
MLGHDNKLSRVIEAVEQLAQHFTPKQAVVFALKEGFQYRANEIAELLGTTEMAVKSVFHRAKSRLEKSRHENESCSAGIYWPEEEQEKLLNLFSKALTNQDPAVLIQAIPDLQSLAACTENQPQAASNRSFAATTPANALCMAA